MNNSTDGLISGSSRPITMLASLAICVLVALPVLSVENPTSANRGRTSGTATTTSTSQTAAASTTIAQINWAVVGQGATNSTNSQFQIMGTAGQTAIGGGIAATFTLGQGFWQGTGLQSCCIGITGNVDDDPDQMIDIGDLTAIIQYLYIFPNPTPPCPEEADIDGDADGVLDIGDVAALIGYLYIPPHQTPAPCR